VAYQAGATQPDIAIPISVYEPEDGYGAAAALMDLKGMASISTFVKRWGCANVPPPLAAHVDFRNPTFGGAILRASPSTYAK